MKDYSDEEGQDVSSDWLVVFPVTFGEELEGFVDVVLCIEPVDGLEKLASYCLLLYLKTVYKADQAFIGFKWCVCVCELWPGRLWARSLETQELKKAWPRTFRPWWAVQTQRPESSPAHKHTRVTFKSNALQYCVTTLKK